MSALGVSSSLSGCLDDLDVLDVVEMLVARERTGTLTVSGPSRGEILMHRGGFVAVTSSSSPSQRGQLDPIDGLSDADWERACLREDPIASLLEAGDIDLERSRTSVGQAIVEGLLELCLPAEGEFRFDERPPGPDPVLLFDGPSTIARTRGREQWREIAQRIPSTALVVHRRPRLGDGVETITLTASAWLIAGLVDGRSTVAELIAQSGLAAVDGIGAVDELLRFEAIELGDALA